MGAFRTMFGGVWGTVVAVGTVLALPVVVLGVHKAWQENPEGFKDRGQQTSYAYDWEQFKEGASFGLYEPNVGFSAEKTADVVYDTSKSVGQSTVKFGERIFNRAAEDLTGKKAKSNAPVTQAQIDACMLDTTCTDPHDKPAEP